MILLPVLNEAEGLRAVLKTIPHASLEEEGWQSDVVIVDGKSTDSSQQVGAEGGCIVLVQPSKGKGEAVRLGFTYALEHHYDAVIMFDADQTYNPADMLRMLARLESGVVVVGNRLNRHSVSYTHLTLPTTPYV